MPMSDRMCFYVAYTKNCVNKYILQDKHFILAGSKKQKNAITQFYALFLNVQFFVFYTLFTHKIKKPCF